MEQQIQSLVEGYEMNIDASNSSGWMTEFHKQVQRGKHVLLYGNVSDLFLLNGSYLSLQKFLADYLLGAGYELVGRYDVVDGLQTINPEKMDARFEEILKTSLGGAPVAPVPNSLGQPTQSGERGSASSPSDPPRAVPHARQGSFLGGLRTPDQAFAAIRTVLERTPPPAAIIVHFTDQLTTHSDHLPEAERNILVQLKKVIHNAGYNQTGSLTGKPNLLTLVAAHLGKVPAWFYQDNPLLALVQIPRPSWPERKSFLCNFAKHFHEGDRIATDKISEIAREFADLTDGLTAWDLESVRRTSRAEQLSIARPKALVDYYKYGRRDDPWERLDAARIRVAKEELGKRVIGQPSAVDAVVRMLLSARVGISLAGGSAKRGKPKGTFFFVGPTGVGKTELAKALSEFLFGDDSAFARFDMSEYAEQHAAEKLTGSPPGFVGYEEGGHLTNRVRERPFSLLLFDEIEKAHGRVMDKFLQVLEDGRLTDGKGQTAFFSQAVVIFTSNIGSDTLELSTPGGALPEYDGVRDHYLAAVRAHFTRPPAQGGLGRPELLNRLGDNILVFDMLRPSYTTGICKKFLALLAESAKDRAGLILEFPDGSVVDMIRREMETATNLLFGGRRIKSLLETLVEQPLNQWVFFKAPQPATRLNITADSGTTILRINGTQLDNN
jgi:hypothetical protein